LIHDAPTNANIMSYIEVMKTKNVAALVRAAQFDYSIEPLEKAGIKVLDLPFEDGSPPPEHVVIKWLALLEQVFSGDDKKAVAVHCSAGVGRAPVLAAIALVEAGMDAQDAIQFIRKKRKGVINAGQLKYLDSYKRRTRTKKKGCLVS